MKEYLENYEEVLKAQNSSDQGLSTGEAEKRLAQYGKNKLKEAKKDSILKRFLKELSDPMILILIAAAIISGNHGVLSAILCRRDHYHRCGDHQRRSQA